MTYKVSSGTLNLCSVSQGSNLAGHSGFYLLHPAKFDLNRPMFGVSGQKKKPKLLFLWLFCFTRATALTNIPEIHRICVQLLQSPYSLKIWWDSVHKSAIYNNKTTRLSLLSKTLGALAQKLGVGSQNNYLRRNGMEVLYLHAKFVEIETEKRCFLSCWPRLMLVSQICCDVQHFNEV